MMRSGRGWFLAVALAAAGCTTERPMLAGDGMPSSGRPGGMMAMTPAGAYLSGRIAQEDRDFPAALAFYQAALASAPGDPELNTRVFVLATTEGRFDLAWPLAQKLLGADVNAPLPNLVAAVELLKNGRPDDALAHAGRIPREGYYQPCGALARAWSSLAANNQAGPAMAALDEIGGEGPLQALKVLHRALLADVAGDENAAAEAYSHAIGGGLPSLRLVQLAGNFYERHGRRDDALRLYQSYAGTAEGDIGVLPEAAAPNHPPAPIVPDAKAGMAEAMFDLASLLSQAASPDVAVLNARLALELRPDMPLAKLVLGDSLEAENRPHAALDIYKSIDRAAPLAWAARIREAEIADTLGDAAAAEQTLQAMAAERANQAEAPLALGAVYREHNDFKAAIAAYSEGLARLGANPSPRFWSVYYSRGIAEEQAGDWQAAKDDLQRALTLDPDNADVMNYLGYSLVERKQDLPEALRLIQRAVSLQPENGYIVDSLGWAYFRTGQIKDAVATLEKAVELKPGDAEINDHLGDAYWHGGRHEEARLQWQRALSLKPEPGVAQQIAAKLDRPTPVRLKTARKPD